MNKNAIIAELDKVEVAVIKAYPSIFTKDDVVSLLRDLQSKLVVYASDSDEDAPASGLVLTDEQVKSLTLAITDAICGHSDPQSLVSDYDLSMSYREVELDSLSFDDGNIEDIVQYGINEWIEKQNK